VRQKLLTRQMDVSTSPVTTMGFTITNIT